MIKQVIVIRKDLKLRRGKECSQAAHASMKFMVERIISYLDDDSCSDRDCCSPTPPLDFSFEEREWMRGIFTKITLQVNSEKELMDIYEAALEEGLEVGLIQDSGKTEFRGVPTYTCLAIGPDTSEKIDKVTSHLKLY